MSIRIISLAVLLVTLFVASGCTTVDVTKTAKGFYPATDPNEVEILMTIPDRKYIELGTVTTRGWAPSATAKMHNALRAKTSPLGAEAVILTATGLDANGYLWGNGVAVKFK